MSSFPHPGSVTICEINRDLITADNLSDDIAKESYAKILGTVFSPVPFQTEFLNSTGTAEHRSEQEEGNEECDKRSGLSAGLKLFFTDSIRRLFKPNDVKLLPDVDLHGVSWHQHKNILAFISGPNHITIRDYEDSELKEPCTLSNESQRRVKLLEWRPNGGRTLSVACKGGICLWTASYPGNAAPVSSRVSSSSLSRGSGYGWTLVDFLRCPDDEQISALSWSPDGRYLASGSYESSLFTIWDVAQGVGTPIRRGFGGISIVKWSPAGDYFFAANDGTFYLWETNTWTSEQWSSSGGFVTGATWDPDGRMILIAFSESSALGSIHFASKPPSLDAHLLPVELPEIQSLTHSSQIEKITWDASGERLAVSYKDGDELYKGLIAIYDVKRTPLVSASLVGFIRGPGDSPRPITFSFNSKFKQGPLLSVVSFCAFIFSFILSFPRHVDYMSEPVFNYTDVVLVPNFMLAYCKAYHLPCSDTFDQILLLCSVGAVAFAALILLYFGLINFPTQVFQGSCFVKQNVGADIVKQITVIYSSSLAEIQLEDYNVPDKCYIDIRLHYLSDFCVREGMRKECYVPASQSSLGGSRCSKQCMLDVMRIHTSLRRCTSHVR